MHGKKIRVMGGVHTEHAQLFGSFGEKMNIEHRTSNIKRRIKNSYGAEGRRIKGEGW
jgi:dihydrodipicolinate reductase